MGEMTRWRMPVRKGGKYRGSGVVPADVVRPALHPAIGLPNTLGESLGYWEILNPAYGMGRQTASYRGKLLTFHGGDLPGFHSQISFMPNDTVGVIRLVQTDHSAPLYNVIGSNRYQRPLVSDKTPCS